MTELLIAFGAGLISFLSPCVLPLIPGYVSFISGQSLQDILESKKIKFLPKRPGERYASALINKNLSNKIYKYYGKVNLKDYINNFILKKS